MTDTERSSFFEAIRMEEQLLSIEKEEKRWKDIIAADDRRLANFKEAKRKGEEENQNKIADAARRQLDWEWDRAIALDELEAKRAKAAEERMENQSKVLQNMQQDIDRMRDAAIGQSLDFSISSGSFGPGPAPVGALIGEQSGDTTNKHLEDIKAIEKEMLNVMRNGIGVTVGP
jgi:hypothetical protein